MKIEELKFPKRKKKKKSSILSPDEKREMREWASSNDAAAAQRSGSQETTITGSRSLPKKTNYEELKPISDADKEYRDGHESDSEILQYDSDEGSVESKESDNGESLNLERVFETSDENSFLIGNSSRFGRSVKFNRRYL